MGDRHLAGTEAVEAHAILEGRELARQPLLELRCRQNHLEFALQPLRQGFGHLHDQVRLCSLLSSAGLMTRGRRRRRPDRANRPETPKPEAGLVRAEGLEPPRLSPLEPKSSASTNSATPARGCASRRPPGRGSISCGTGGAAKKFARGPEPRRAGASEFPVANGFPAAVQALWLLSCASPHGPI